MVKSLLYPLLLYTKAIFIVMCPLNYVKISVVPFAILIFTLCMVRTLIAPYVLVIRNLDDNHEIDI